MPSTSLTDKQLDIFLLTNNVFELFNAECLIPDPGVETLIADVDEYVQNTSFRNWLLNYTSYEFSDDGIGLAYLIGYTCLTAGDTSQGQLFWNRLVGWFLKETTR